MSGYLLFKLATCAVSLCTGTLVAARSSALLVDRLIGAALLCGAHWSFCEMMSAGQTDPDAAATWLRLSALGWMWIGPLVFQILAVVLGDRAGRISGVVPLLHGAALAGILLYVATPWALVRVEPASWGWVPVFGPLFPVAYAPSVLPLVIGLLSWKRVNAVLGSSGERRHALRLYRFTVFAAILSSATDFVLPAAGVHLPGLGSFSIAFIGLLLVHNLQRRGYLVLTPAAFAHEILESLQDGVALLLADGRMHSANRSLERMASVPRGGLEGRRAIELLPDLRRRAGNEIFSHTTHLLIAGDQSIPVSVTSLSLRNPRGFMLGEALVIKDLREVVELRRRLVTAGRLAAVGELSAGISHEISTPVSSVLGNLEALRQEWDRATAAVHGPALVGLEKTIAEGEEMIDECIEGVERVAEVVREVRNFSRLENGHRELADVSELVANALRLATPHAPASVALLRDLAAKSMVFCAPQKLERVVLNLLLNSIYAVEGEGTVRLSTEDLGERVRICVEDDGGGISAADRERIFDPFFTTKPVGEGTGLGLSISYHIVRSHGGSIEVDSQPGHTRFTIELPSSRG